jgi:hypothetical protein
MDTLDKLNAFGVAEDWVKANYKDLKEIQLTAEREGRFPRYLSDEAKLYRDIAPEGMDTETIAYCVNKLITEEFGRPTGILHLIGG